MTCLKSLIGDWLKRSYFITAFLMIFCITGLGAEQYVYPVDVNIWTPPYNRDFERVQDEYTGLDQAEKAWNICVLIPHFKDAFWIGVDYGLIDEAKRLGVTLEIFSAGGYGNLRLQREQFIDCLNRYDVDAIILSAVSAEGLTDLIEEASNMGIPVIDLINGVSSTSIKARVANSYWDNGYQIGLYLRYYWQHINEPVQAAWFPGPEGAGWVLDADNGFREGIKNSLVEIVDVKFGDTDTIAQRALIKEVLAENPDVDVVVGNAVAAAAAVRVVRELEKEISIFSYYYTPDVHRALKRGKVVASPTDAQILQARIAVDTAVRILEGKEFVQHLAPIVEIVDWSTVQTYDTSLSLAPMGFRPMLGITQ
jgi:protein TorT